MKANLQSMLSFATRSSAMTTRRGGAWKSTTTGFTTEPTPGRSGPESPWTLTWKNFPAR